MKKDRHSIFHQLQGIYPPAILALVLLPTIIGLLIDYQQFELRNLLIDFIWLPLFTIPNYWIRQKAYIKLISAFFFVLGFVQITHWIIIKGPLTLTSLLVISNTNLSEAVDFFNLKASVGLLLLIPYSYLLILSFKKIPSYEMQNSSPWLTLVILGVSIIFITENAFNQRLVRKGIPQIAKVGFSFYERLQLFEEAAKDSKPKKVNASASKDMGKQTLVLIIGESCSKRHMSLYGYQRSTNPNLLKRADLFVLKDVVSPYSNTLQSLLSSLSKSSLENNLEATDEIDAIDVFHSAGFKTFWISNQSPIGIWDNQVTVLANQSDVVSFVNLSSNSSFEATYTTSFDDKVFEPFQMALQDSSSKKLIVVHLMGSHASYRKRYPKEFAQFKDHSDQRQGIISEYDNSVLYNDFIVDRLFNMTSSECDGIFSSAIYVSDHGENIYDEFDKVGHDYAKSLPKVNVEVPLLLWLSPFYMKQDPSRLPAIKLNLDKAYVTDDLFHSLLDIALINSPHLDPSKSVFNQHFNSNRTRILEDGLDYDQK